MINKRKYLNKNEVVFYKGEQPDYAYLVEKGTLLVFSDKDAKTSPLGTVHAGDLLGEMAILDNFPRTATVIAETDCVLLKIDPIQFAERISNADPIIASLLESLLKRYRLALANINGHTSENQAHEKSIIEKVMVEKIRLESQFKNALATNSLDVRYQPLLEIATDQIVGYEALMRWQHPERGFISPAEFIKLAEETSLIVEVGEFVIDTACQAVSTLIEHGASPSPFIAVNVAPNQLSHPGLIERIVERVDKAGLPKGSLKIEVTESQTLVSKEVQKTINLCHEHGIKVALDDFGTGYSNLTQLHEFNFDTIKVDQAFVKTAETNPRSMILIKSIIEMCHLLGADVLIEGIEDKKTLDKLNEYHCRYAQGYGIGMPQTLDDIIKNMKK